MLEPKSPGDPMTVRLVGGPYHDQIVPVPGGTQVWEIAEPWRRISLPYEVDRLAPGPRHLYRLDPHWREFVGQEPLPFVYAGTVGEEEGV
jgi:hypothetical protein